jgi:hypothetical protein
MNEVQNVLVTEISHDQQYYVGHNKFYDQVRILHAQQYYVVLITQVWGHGTVFTEEDLKLNVMC